MTKEHTHSQLVPDGAKGNVLLVDDDKFLVDMYAMKFTQSGFNAHATLSAAEALKTLHDGFPADVILLDLIMPGEDGFSFLETLRKEKTAPNAVIIALTNEMNDAEQAKVMELGGSRYIVKATMLPSEVVNTVAEEIARRNEG